MIRHHDNKTHFFGENITYSEYIGTSCVDTEYVVFDEHQLIPFWWQIYTGKSSIFIIFPSGVYEEYLGGPASSHCTEIVGVKNV